MPRFSIITCTRNSAATLPETLKSVAAQRDADYEHVFVDGDSTDATLDMLQAQPGRKRILTGVAGGISRAMNAGVAAATGDIVAHLHSDDYYLHDRVLARVAEHMEADGSDWLFGRVAFRVGDALEPEHYATPPVTPAKLLRRNYVPHPATFVRRSVFDRFGGFDERYRLAMDYEFWLRIAPHCRLTQLDEALSAFRVHAGSATEKHAMASLHEDFKARFAHGGWHLWPEFAARYVVRLGRRMLA